MTVGKIENGLERGFVKHGVNCLLITDPRCFIVYIVIIVLDGFRKQSIVHLFFALTYEV